MDYEHFFQPFGVALNVMGNFRVEIGDHEDNVNARFAQQGAIAAAQRPPDTFDVQRRYHGRVIHPVWFGIVPLPVVNYTLLWRRYGPSDLRQALLQAGEIASLIVKSFFRAVIYLTYVYFWARIILTSLASCGNMVTFSNSFFSDILTFSLRNYPSLVPRHYELVVALKTGKMSSVAFDSPFQFLFDTAALQIHVTCIQNNGTLSCELVKSSLIFKLCDILKRCYSIWDYLPSAFLTATTVGLYVLYVLGAQILNINVVALVSFITWKRQYPLTKFVIELVKSVWTGSPTNVV